MKRCGNKGIYEYRRIAEMEYKSAAGGFPKAEFWRSFSALANTNGGTGADVTAKGWKTFEELPLFRDNHVEI